MKGVQVTPTGYRAFVRVKGHPLKTKRFKKDTTEAEMKLWRERERAKLILLRDQRSRPRLSGTFRSDAVLYMESVTAMPTYKERVKHIFEWVSLFGEQDTETIAPAQIRAQRDRWLTVGPRTRQRGKVRIVEAKPLSASSVNHRLRALENMWTVLWPGIPNPVRQVPEADEPKTLPRGLTAGTIDAIFAKLPTGKTKARLSVLRWTGLPAKTLMRLKPEDVDLQASVMYLPGRKKGQGTRGEAMPLLPQAVTAFQALTTTGAWGAFSTSAMHKLFRKAGGAAVTPYQLRHTFATIFLHVTKDLRATQRALNHSTLDLTQRYAYAAVDGALASAFKKVAKASLKVAKKVTTTRKRP